ncbi:MAG: hypothetical protein HW389_3462, partial [Bacteroidetes bacterium]|nr:hypothetical protein [Bacteroidota bacterium]
GVQIGAFMADQYRATAAPMLFPALVFLLDTISESVCILQTRIVAPDEQTKELKESLSLTDEQAAKLLKIYRLWEEEMSNVLGSGDDNRVTKGEVLLELMKGSEKQIDSLLTVDQQRNLIRFGLGV